jgi:protein-disulfide isomerase
MTRISRRQILMSSTMAAAAFMPVAALAATPDLSTLNEPSAIGEMVEGLDTAKVTIIEYASASCPHCADFYKMVYGPLKKDYIDTGKVRFIFREFPHNDAAMAAFMVARCAPKEKFFPLMDVYFTTQPAWVPNPLEGLQAIAQQIGMTAEQFQTCIKNEAVAKGIFEVRKRAETYGVDSIPTFFINGVRFEGDRTIETFKAKIDPLLM